MKANVSTAIPKVSNFKVTLSRHKGLGSCQHRSQAGNATEKFFKPTRSLIYWRDSEDASRLSLVYERR